MQLTADDRNALEFYEANASYVQGFGISNLGDREERQLFRRGAKLSDLIISSAKSTVTRSNAARWTDDDYFIMASAYMVHGRDQLACIEFCRAAGMTRQSDNAIRLAAYSCAALDSKVTECNGLKDYANGLLAALQSLESGRFYANR